MEYNGLDISLGGELIVRIGDPPVASAQDVSRAVTRLACGPARGGHVLRGGTAQVVQVTLGERLPEPACRRAARRRPGAQYDAAR